MSEPRHRINLFYLPDGRYVEYQGLAHLVSNLLELHEVAAICAYRGNSPSLLRMGLFDNPFKKVKDFFDNVYNYFLLKLARDGFQHCGKITCIHPFHN